MEPLNLISALFSIISLSLTIRDSYIYIFAKDHDLSNLQLEDIGIGKWALLVIFIFFECSSKLIAWG